MLDPPSSRDVLAAERPDGLRDDARAHAARRAQRDRASTPGATSECCLPGARRARRSRRRPEASTCDGRRARLRGGRSARAPGVRGRRRPDAPPRGAPRPRPTTSTDELRPATDSRRSRSPGRAADALPFPLCLSASRPTPSTAARRRRRDASRAATSCSPTTADVAESAARGAPSPPDGARPDAARTGRASRHSGPLTVRDAPFDDATAAGRALPTTHRPGAAARSPRRPADGRRARPGAPQRDLLDSDRFAPSSWSRSTTDGARHLRFGDGEHGRGPAQGVAVRRRLPGRQRRAPATSAPRRSRRLVARRLRRRCIERAQPARRARAAPIPSRSSASGSTRRRRSGRRSARSPRPTTPTVAERHPEVQRAAATLRWTGSWYTTVRHRRPAGGRAGRRRLRGRAARATSTASAWPATTSRSTRRASCRSTSLLEVCVEPGYFRSDVKQALLERLSSRVLPDGQRGFFHPDNFTFGQPVYLSPIFAAAMAVSGRRDGSALTLPALRRSAAAGARARLLRVGAARDRAARQRPELRRERPARARDEGRHVTR